MAREGPTRIKKENWGRAGEKMMVRGEGRWEIFIKNEQKIESLVGMQYSDGFIWWKHFFLGKNSIKSAGERWEKGGREGDATADWARARSGEGGGSQCWDDESGSGWKRQKNVHRTLLRDADTRECETGREDANMFQYYLTGIFWKKNLKSLYSPVPVRNFECTGFYFSCKGAHDTCTWTLSSVGLVILIAQIILTILKKYFYIS